MLITKPTEETSSWNLVLSEVTMKYLDSTEPEISLFCSKEPDYNVYHQLFVTKEQATKTQMGVEV
jgi:hypothetical protein